MPPHRIALVSSSYHPYAGGVEEHVRQVAAVLRARGHAVEVWTVDRGERLGARVVDGIDVRYLPTPMPARSASAVGRFLLRFPRAAFQWWRSSRTLRPDVLHVHCFGPNGVYALALARTTRIPLVVTAHGESFADDHRVFDSSPLMGRSLRQAMAGADRVTGCSEIALDDLRKRFGLHGGVVTGNGVDVDGGVTGLPREDPPVVFAVGRVEHTKGFDLLLRAFADAGLADRARLVIGGDGADRSALQAEVARLGLGDAVSLPGRLEPTEVARRMATASVVVVPSRREAFGIVALEAWRAGTPLVATNLGGPVEFVRDGIDGLLVDPEDTDALGRAIVRVLDDADLGGRMSAAGLVKVREFSWDLVVDRYEALVDEVVR